MKQESDTQQRRRINTRGAAKNERASGSRAGEAIEGRRRRYGDRMNGRVLNLHVPAEMQEDFKRRGLVTRWIRQDPMRMESLTKYDDWDVVKNDSGQIVTKAAGKDTDNGVMVLLAKPREYHEADRKERRRMIMQRLGDAAEANEAGDPLSNIDRGTSIQEWVPSSS